MNDGYILIVDDRDEDVELTVRALKKAGVRNRIVVVRDGIEAVALLDAAEEAGGAPSELPALVLLDINMPRMNGIAVLERLAAIERMRAVPFVMFTSSNEERDVRESYEHGAKSFIRKPIGGAEFAASVASIAEYWLSTNQGLEGNPQ